MSDMNKDWIEQMQQNYNVAPETPTDEMWSAIESRLGAESSDVIPISSVAGRGRRAPTMWMGWVAAAAAILVLGIGLGRMSVEVTPEGRVLTTQGGSGALSASYRTATMRHLSKSEDLLTFVRNDAREGRVDDEVGRWGRSLLLETRLLMDSPAGDDELLRRLLVDLELILVQVAGLAPDQGLNQASHQEELTLIAEAMLQQDMMMRIRSVLPVGAAQAGI